MGNDKSIEIMFEGNSCRFSMNLIDRKKLYGFRKRIAFDENDEECSTALLTKDGRFLLPSGSTAGLYVNDTGDAVERNELVAVDCEGDRLPEHIAGSEQRSRIEGPVAAEELLNCTVQKVYELSPQTLDPSLECSLAEGNIFLMSGHRGGGEQPAFLLANTKGIFLLATRPCRFEFVSLDQPIADTEDEDELEADDFSFDFAVGESW